jgi:hypothetical protein
MIRCFAPMENRVMAYDAPYEWVQPRRWRRWVARCVALLALVACGAGVYQIVHEATRPGPSPPVSLQPQVRRIASSSEALGRRLQAVRPGREGARERALAAVREARSDRRAASEALRRRQATGTVRDATLIANALAAHRAYLTVVAAVLRKPAARASETAAGRLPRLARRAMAAWAALPDPAGLPQSLRGYRRLAVLAGARRG